MNRLARIGAYFFEPDGAEPRPDAATPQRAGDASAAVPPSRGGASGRDFASHGAASAAASASPGAAREVSPASDGSGSWTRAAVVGSDAVVVPVAAACAGELRAREHAPAAALCVWRAVPAPVGPAEPGAEVGFAPFPEAVPEEAAPATTARDRPRQPTAATTPGARRLATRLAAQDLAAAACGRLAWVTLPAEPEAAVEQVGRCLRCAAAPVILAIACPRPAAFEPLLAELDLAVAVLPADADSALRALTLASLRARERHIVPPLPPGPPRWAAMAGLARLRSLPLWEAGT